MREKSEQGSRSPPSLEDGWRGDRQSGGRQTVIADAEWEAANAAKVQERFTQWLAS